jgi:hypothetical protein
VSNGETIRDYVDRSVACSGVDPKIAPSVCELQLDLHQETWYLSPPTARSPSPTCPNTHLTASLPSIEAGQLQSSLTSDVKKRRPNTTSGLDPSSWKMAAIHLFDVYIESLCDEKQYQHLFIVDAVGFMSNDTRYTISAIGSTN